MRNEFINNLIQLRTKNKKVILAVGDLGYSIIEPFVNKYPESYFNVGVAEQNLVGISSGFAAEGYLPYVYSISNFLLFRAAEQIRNDIDYQNLKVILVGVGGGLKYGNLGYTHHIIQDYSLIRIYKNFLIFSPCSINELNKYFTYKLKMNSSIYLRLGRGSKKIKDIEYNDIFEKKIINFKNIILITGDVLEIAQEYQIKYFKDYKIISVPIWGKKVSLKIFKILKFFKKIIVIEDHIYEGGFACWVLEIFNKNNENIEHIKSIHLSDDVVNAVGSEDYLLKKYLKII